MFIDTHCHLDFGSFDEDRENVVQRAIKNKINAIITIGTDIESSENASKLAEKFALIHAAVGIHPNDCSDTGDKDLAKIRQMADREKVVAIGEIGLDYYRTYAEKEKQKEVFRKQIRLARELNLPIIVHDREAHDDLLEILVDEKAYECGGVLHSFSGNVHFLETILPYNFYVSFTGSVTFKNANYDEVLEKVPLSNLLLETDSPFLAPVPFRGKRNEPAYIRYTAEKIAQIKNVSIEKLADITTQNAKKLFKID